MMAINNSNRSKPTSLTAQIKDAERQVSKRQEEVSLRATTLVRKIHQKMSAPATLLLAGGIGFIIGDLTKCQPSGSRGTADKQCNTETSPLRTALNLLTSAHTLYTALPIAWIIKSFHQPDTSGRQTPERQFHKTASGAAGN